MKELPKSYNPKDNEARIYKMWESGKYFKPAVDSKKKPYVIAIPPPNVTGSLHMGHALQGTIMDVLGRWHRMMGEPTLILPGTDHAGIATQNVVEKKLAKEGKSRYSLGRAKFLKEVWGWKDEYESRILGQFKQLGCSFDWSRTRFTMDEKYTQAVLKSFVHYYNQGWLYRGTRIINWCPRCETSLSDLEVEHKDREDSLWHIKYEVEGGGSIVVATTRPESMLGDTAIAVNPKDKRYIKLVGKTAVLPIVGRKIPIVADITVDMAFGTGAVKVTPAHDPLDYEIAERHSLEKIIVIDPKGKMTKEAGDEFFGLDRYAARKKVVELLENSKRLIKTEPLKHAVGHCERCHTVIEPLLSLQWFVKMEELAKPAIKAAKEKKVQFQPAKWEKVYLNWMDNIKDWCVSRQIWWGHRLPVYYCKQEEIKNQKSKIKNFGCDNIIVSTEKPKKCPKCGSTNIEQDPDVLDTWFSSALWPFATLGWPEKTNDLKRFYPTTFVPTAREILYLWIARMIFSGIEFTNEKPFDVAYIHPTILAKDGRRMSKSLGTGVDPLELIEKYGSDATRFGLLWQMAQGQDVRFGEEALLNAQRFANKIWNASRFVMMNLKGYKNVSPASNGKMFHVKHLSQGGRETISKKLCSDDKKIIAEFEKVISKTNKYLTNYDFQHAEEAIYEFFWHEFCDKYIEIAKNRIRDGAKDKIAAQYTLDYVLKGSLKLLHPFMPFVTEAIWQNLGEKEALIISKWPE